MRFLIVTPSFNQFDYLKRCIASVADQAAESMEHGAERIEVHHYVQDACSTDGTADWLRQYDEEIGGSQSGTNNQYPITTACRGALLPTAGCTMRSAKGVKKRFGQHWEQGENRFCARTERM
jgi:GT2 family glycosyltransferase